MARFVKSSTLLSILLLLGGTAAVLAQTDAEARQQRILENLKLKFPQLREIDVQMGNIEPSPHEGLDQGSFLVGGRQNQAFLVTHDDTALYMIAGEPIDVSQTAEEIQAALAEQERSADIRASEVKNQLHATLTGLPFRGKADAPVTVVEFSDFQCPYCARGAQTMEQVLEKYGDKVKFVFAHFPLGFHPWAMPAAIASACAAQQTPEAFWQLHDGYFADQKAFTPGNVSAKSRELLADSGIDLAAWGTCVDDPDSAAHQQAQQLVQAQMQTGQQFGVSGTPGFFVNGQFLNGAQPLASFEPLIDAALAGASTN